MATKYILNNLITPCINFRVENFSDIIAEALPKVICNIIKNGNKNTT